MRPKRYDRSYASRAQDADARICYALFLLLDGWQDSNSGVFLVGAPKRAVRPGVVALPKIDAVVFFRRVFWLFDTR